MKEVLKETMTRGYRQGIKGILSLGPTPTKPKIIKHEPDLYEDVFSPDAPVVLTPGITPKKEKKERTDKKYRYGRAMEWITRKKPTEQEIQDKEFWEAYNNSEKMVGYINKYGDGPKIEAPKKYPVKPIEQNKGGWKYEPWGSEVNLRPEKDQKARKTTNTNKEKTDG